jgi:hypothetical protein
MGTQEGKRADLFVSHDLRRRTGRDRRPNGMIAVVSSKVAGWQRILGHR